MRKSKINIAARVRAMQQGETFIVSNKSQQMQALQAGKALYMADAISFRITTYKDEKTGDIIVARVG